MVIPTGAPSVWVEAGAGLGTTAAEGGTAATERGTTASKRGTAIVLGRHASPIGVSKQVPRGDTPVRGEPTVRHRPVSVRVAVEMLPTAPRVAGRLVGPLLPPHSVVTGGSVSLLPPLGKAAHVILVVPVVPPVECKCVNVPRGVRSPNGVHTNRTTYAVPSSWLLSTSQVVRTEAVGLDCAREFAPSLVVTVAVAAALPAALTATLTAAPLGVVLRGGVVLTTRIAVVRRVDVSPAPLGELGEEALVADPVASHPAGTTVDVHLGMCKVGSTRVHRRYGRYRRYRRRRGGTRACG